MNISHNRNCEKFVNVTKIVDNHCILAAVMIQWEVQLGVIRISAKLPFVNERIDSKMKVTVCIGSSCHIKGSRQVVQELQKLVNENNLGDKVELGGTFCLGKCQQGVCVTVDEDFHSVTPETVSEFFKNEIAAKV